MDVYVIQPPDASEHLFVFADEEEATRYAEARFGTGFYIEQSHIISGQLAAEMIADELDE